MPENEDRLSAAATANLITTLAAAKHTTNKTTPPRRSSRFLPLCWVIFAMATAIMAYVLFLFTETQNSPPASTGSSRKPTTSCERVPFLDPYENVFSISAHDMAGFVPDDDDTKRVWQRAVDSVIEAADGLSDAAEVHIENRRRLMARLEPVDVSLQTAADELQAVPEDSPPPGWHILMGPSRRLGPMKKESLASINGRVLDAARQVSSVISSDWKKMQEQETLLEREMQKQRAGILHHVQESLELLHSQTYPRLSGFMVFMKRSQNMYSGLHIIKWLVNHVLGKDGSWLTDDAEMVLEAIMRHHAGIAVSHLAIDTTSTFLAEDLEAWGQDKNQTNKLLDRVDSQVQVLLRRTEHLESTRHDITVDQLVESLRMATGLVQRLRAILNQELQAIMETWAHSAGYYWVNLCPS